MFLANLSCLQCMVLLARPRTTFLFAKVASADQALKLALGSAVISLWVIFYAIAVLVSALSHACDPAENSWSLPPSAALMKRSARNTRAARLKCIGAAPHLRG